MAVGSEPEASPSGAAAVGERLVGYAAFKRNNPRSDRFGVQRFHHVEFYSGEAAMTWRR